MQEKIERAESIMNKKDKFSEKELINPAKSFRPITFWAWSGEIKEKEILRQLVLMKKQRIGAAMIYPRYGLITRYLSEEYFERVKFTVETARRLNLDIWLYDEFCFPSGTANGEVTKNPKFREKYLRCNCKNIQGRLKVVSFKIMEEDDKRYVDTLNEEAIKKFIQLTHEKYYQKIGKHFGRTVKGIFTDEPSLGYRLENNKKVGENLIIKLPWTEELPMVFEKKKGYNLIKMIPDFFGDSKDSEKCRQDFQEICTFLFEKSYHRQISDWCQQHRILYTGHLLGEEPIGNLILYNGDYFTQARNFHLPGIDEITTYASLKEKDAEVVAPKMAQSTAEQTGAKRTMIELYAYGPSEMTMNKMKRMINYESVFGLNTFLLAICPYSLEGNSIKTGYFSTLFYQQPWFKYMHLYSDYVGRISYLLTRGNRVATVGIVFPTKSYWRRNLANRDKNSAWEKQEKALSEIAKLLLEKHIDFGFLWETNLHNAEIRNGEIIVGGERFKTLISPPVEKLTEEMDIFLKKFSDSGGKVIRINSINREYLRKKFLALKDRDIEIKVKGKPARGIFYQHRSTVNEEIYFFANTEMVKLDNVEIIFHYINQEVPFKVNLDNGKLIPVKCIRRNGVVKIYSNFEKGEGFGVMFSNNKNKLGETMIPNKLLERKVLTLDGEWDFTALRRNSLRLKGWRNESTNIKSTTFFIKDLPENISFYYQENMIKKIKINKREIYSNPKRSYYLDESYLEIDIRNYVVKGKNRVTIETNQKADFKFLPFALLLGNFSISQDRIVKPVRKMRIGDWSKQGYPEYAGTGIYKKNFYLPKKRVDTKYILKIDVGDDIAEVNLNGKSIGIRAWQPYEYDLTNFLRQGRNILAITVTNSVRNIFGNFANKEIKDNPWISATTKPAGLLDSPTIYITKRRFYD